MRCIARAGVPGFRASPLPNLPKHELVPRRLLAAMLACESDLTELEHDHRHVHADGDIEGDGRTQRRIGGGHAVEELDDRLKAGFDADPPDEECQLRTEWVGVQLQL